MSDIFPMIPASSRAFWVPAGIGLLMVGILGLFIYIAYSSRNVRFEVSEGGLAIRGGLYGRTVAAESLILDQAQPLDLRGSGDHAPRTRTNGIGMPGYLAGWFRLRNREKALLFVTDRSSVVHIPTTEGYSLLLSVADPEVFLGALRRACGRS
jgi:hypothetical protein